MENIIFHNQYRNKNIEIIMIHNDEKWLKITNDMIPNIQPWYYISNYGRIYSILRKQMISHRCNNRGYHLVTLRSINNTPIDVLVHRILMIAFHPISNYEEMQVNHIDGLKYNNTETNLEWTNQSENIIHAYNNGLYHLGEDRTETVLTNAQVDQICKCLCNKMKYKDICNYIGIEYNKKTISILCQIKCRNNWKHISCKYDF